MFYYETMIADFGNDNDKQRPKKEKYYKIKLKKNQEIKELFTENEAEFKILRFHLRNKCILTTFQTEFQVIKSIGKGSFAKVKIKILKISDK